MAADLAAAGLRRVNISLDAIDPDRYAALTRGGDVRQALAGIAAARAAGLLPVKLNCVVRESPDEPDARDVAAFGRQVGLRGALRAADGPASGPVRTGHRRGGRRLSRAATGCV